MRHRNGTCTASGSELEALGRQLTEWRRTHKAPTPIPHELWAKATELAGRHGVGPTARALRLDYAALRRRTQTSLINDNGAAKFMEMLVPQPDSILECAIEVVSARGARMRVEMRNPSAGTLSSIIRDFAG